MKKRSGFVSNSSSSSFIVGFKTIPRSIDEVRLAIFGPDQKEFFSPYSDAKWPVEQVAETVFNDLKGQIPLTENAFIKSTRNCAPYHYSGKKFVKQVMNKNGVMEEETDWEAEQEDHKKRSEKIANKFLDGNKDYYFFAFEYADENGDYFCALEHGDLFRKMPNITINNH